MSNKTVTEAEELAESKGVRVKYDEVPPDNWTPIDFSMYVFSVAHTIQMALGVMPYPEGQELGLDLPLARQFIDILVMLKEKTAGNLTQEEQSLIDALCYELKLAYVSASTAAGSSAAGASAAGGEGSGSGSASSSGGDS